MATLRKVIGAIDDNVFVDIFARPVSEHLFAKVLKEIGIKDWARIIGIYNDPETDPLFRFFIQGEISCLYHLFKLNNKLNAENERGIDFKKVIQRLSCDVLLNVFSQPIPKEDVDLAIAKVKRRKLSKWISVLMKYDEDAGPELHEFIRGVASCLYNLPRIEDTIEMDNQFNMED